MANSTNTSNNDFFDPYAMFDIDIPVAVRFWLYTVFNTLSILCTIFDLYQLLSDRKLRQALNNHIIIILLFTGLVYESTTVPFMLNYYRLGKAWILTPSFARFWTLIDYITYEIELLGFAWATIERHILIFHQQWLATEKKRFFIHYLPIIAIIIYCLAYYPFMIFFPYCQSSPLTQPMNGVPIPCAGFDPILGKYDAICHQMIPTFTIAIFSVGLLLRVIWQKLRMHRTIEWRQQRKMVIQLLSISTLYILFNFPRAIVQAFVISGDTTFVIIKAFTHLTFFSVQLVFFFPFVCCALIPDIEKRLKKMFCCQNKQQTNGPTSTATTLNRTVK